MTTRYNIGHPDPGLAQAQKGGKVKLVNEIPITSFSNGNADISK
jgi:hypothetical protein